MKKQEESAVIRGPKGGKFSGKSAPALKMPKRASIEQIENGYLISWCDHDGGWSDEKHAAADLDEAMGIIKKYMGA